MKNMLTLSNTISLLRAPLAFLFLSQSIAVRLIAIIAAMLTDCFDGYIARKLNNETFLGKVLDPVMDKFFVYFVIGILFFQNNLSVFGLCALLIRDLSVILYVLTTLALYKWKGLVFHPAYSSKITTGFQFLTLLSLVLGFTPPAYLYYSFFLLGLVIYFELLTQTIIHNKKSLLV